jgi:hypothetical protein
VPKRLLESEFAAAVAQELDGKRVAQGVGADADASDAGFAPGRPHQLAEAMRRQRPP